MAINFNDPITIYAKRGLVLIGSKNKKVFLSISTTDIFACSATQPGADLNQLFELTKLKFIPEKKHVWYDYDMRDKIMPIFG